MRKWTAVRYDSEGYPVSIFEIPDGVETNLAPEGAHPVTFQTRQSGDGCWDKGVLHDGSIQVFDGSGSPIKVETAISSYYCSEFGVAEVNWLWHATVFWHDDNSISPVNELLEQARRLIRERG